MSTNVYEDNFIRDKEKKNYDLYIIFYIHDLGDHIIPGIIFFLYNQLKQGPCATQCRFWCVRGGGECSLWEDIES